MVRCLGLASVLRVRRGDRIGSGVSDIDFGASALFTSTKVVADKGDLVGLELP